MSRGPEPETGGLQPDSRHGRARQLLALSSFAITQPLLGLLASAPGFLVAHRVMPADVPIVVAVLILAAPAALFALERAAEALPGRRSTRSPASVTARHALMQSSGPIVASIR